MEGYNPTRPESNSDDDSESSKESKSKKKKRTGATVASSEPKTQETSVKKEGVAEKSKDLFGKLLGKEETSDDQSKKAEADQTEPPETSTTEEANEVTQTEEVTADAAERLDPSIEQLTPAEETEAELFWADARLEELYAGQGQDQTEEDAVVRQASIDFHEGRRQELIDELPEAVSEQPSDPEGGLTVPLNRSAAPNPAELARQQVIEQADEPTEIAEDEPVVLSSRHQSPAKRTVAAPAAPAEAGRYAPDYRTNPNATYLLVGGLVGYFIGRRRGRIKTERQMKKVQLKLEKQIETAQSQIINQESEVQRLARDNYRQKFAKSETAAAEAATSRPKPAVENQPKPIETRPTPVPEAPRAKLEANGQSAAPEKPAKAGSAESTARLTDKEVIDISSKVKVGETNLRQIYEARLVSEAGLRRLVYEHFGGNDIRRALAREFLAKELSYERDPMLRDKLPAELSQNAAVATTAHFNSDDSAVGLTPNSANLASTQSQSQPKSRSALGKSSPQVSSGLLVGLTFVAIALAIFAIVLSVTR